MYSSYCYLGYNLIRRKVRLFEVTIYIYLEFSQLLGFLYCMGILFQLVFFSWQLQSTTRVDDASM